MFTQPSLIIFMGYKYSVNIALIYTWDPKWLPFGRRADIFNIPLCPVVLICCCNHLFLFFWVLFGAQNASPSSSSAPAYSRHPSPGAIVTPFICTRSGAAKQVDKWDLLRAGGIGVQGCWFFHGNGEGYLFFPLGRRLFCMDTRIRNKFKEEQKLNGKAGLRTVQRSPVLMKVNRLGCLLTEKS